MKRSPAHAPQPVSAPLWIEPPYRLRDPAGRALLLDELTSAVTGLESPTQVWHGVCGADVPVQGRGSAAMLTRELAAAARPRRTLLPAEADAAGLMGEPLGESAVRLTLPGGRVGCVCVLTVWPAALTPGWTGALADLGATIGLHLRPVPRDRAAQMLRRRLAMLASTAVLDERAGRLVDPADALAAETGEELRDALARGTTSLLSVQLVLALQADTGEELADAAGELRARLTALVAAASPLRFQQSPGWRAATPGGAPLGWPWRLLDAASVAASIPHPVGPQEQTPGAAAVLAGIDPASGLPLLADRWSAHNPTRLVVGTSGAGKSYAAKLELLRHAAAGTACVVVDPEGEFGTVVEASGGLVLTVGDETTGLDPVGLACRPALPAAEGLSTLTAWASALLGGTLSAVDLALLDRALDVLRADRRAAPHGTSPQAADLLDVVGQLVAHPPFKGADLPARLAPAAGGTIAGLFAPNPALADPPQVVCFDLRAVPGRARPAVMACVLSWAWTQTVGAADRDRRLVILDEAHLLLDDPAAADLLAQFARRARKYRVALEIVTQRLSDFLANPAGQAVLANAATKLLLGCEDHERAAVAAGLGLTGPETELLAAGRRGVGLLITPDRRSPVLLVAAGDEHVLAASGPRR